MEEFLELQMAIGLQLVHVVQQDRLEGEVEFGEKLSMELFQYSLTLLPPLIQAHHQVVNQRQEVVH